MKSSHRSPATGQSPAAGRSRAFLWIVGATLLVVALAFLLPRGGRRATPAEAAGPATGSSSAAVDPSPRAASAMRERARSRLGSGPGGGSGSSEQVVADRVYRFARDRRELAEDLARQLQVQLPGQVVRFFDAVEGGDWGQIKGLYNTLSSEWQSGSLPPELAPIWPAVQEAYRAAHLAVSWSPQELMDYGKTMLAQIPPGSVYLAGTDSAQMATALAGLGGSASPLVVRPSELLSGGYLEYLRLTAGAGLNALTREEVQAALEGSIADAQARAARLAGETIDAASSGAVPDIAAILDGKGGPLDPAVSQRLSAQLIQMLVQKNPGKRFVLEEAGAVPALGANATFNGPYLEVTAGGENAAAVTPAQAAQSIDYWKETAQRLDAAGDSPAESPSRTAYARMASQQADFFAARNLKTEAEQAYRVAHQLAPSAVEPLSGLARYLSAEGRQAEALTLIDEFAQQNESQRYAADALKQSLAAAQNGGR